MPRVRNARLDKLAEAVGDCRDQINQATIDEKSFRAAALKEMQAKEITFWSHGGVDFIRVPGEDKLKVKTHKDGGSSETGGDDVEIDEVETNPEDDPMPPAPGSMHEAAGDGLDEGDELTH